jgi:hypothetical protein
VVIIRLIEKAILAIHHLRQVLNNIRSSPFKDLFNPENFYLSKSGGGAGNNWAKGFELGEEGKARTGAACYRVRHHEALKHGQTRPQAFVTDSLLDYHCRLPLY